MLNITRDGLQNRRRSKPRSNNPATRNGFPPADLGVESGATVCEVA